MTEFKTIAAERCYVCGKKVLPPLIPFCIHTPEEHARADMAQIMKKHRPALRRALGLIHAEVKS